jgi:hypothetical protein
MAQRRKEHTTMVSALKFATKLDSCCLAGLKLYALKPNYTARHSLRSVL